MRHIEDRIHEVSESHGLTKKEHEFQSDVEKTNPKEAISYLEGLLENPESLKRAINYE